MNILNHLVDYGESITLFNPDIVFITCVKEHKARYTAYHNKKGWYIIDDSGIFKPEKIYMDDNGFFIDRFTPYYIDDETNEVYEYPCVNICYKVDENKFDNVYIYANDINEANSLYNRICAKYKKGMDKITFG